MRKYLVTAFAAAFIVILSPTAGRSNPDRETAEVEPIAVQRVVTTSGMRDTAAMVLIGTGLLALAAAVRRAA